MTGKQECTVGRALDVDTRAGQYAVVQAFGTPCNVLVDREGVTVTVWADGLEAPHAALTLTWAELVARAVAL